MESNSAFSHLVVEVSDLDKSEAFYRDVIGLDVLGRDLVGEDRPNTLLATNTRQRVLLIEVDEVPPYPGSGGSIHHAWLLTPEQFKNARDRLESLGFETGIDPRQNFRAVGEYNMDIHDPDGNRYQIQAFGDEATDILPSGAGMMTCGKIDDFAIGSVTAFGKGRFFLNRLDVGFLAFSMWCTHKNGATIWQKESWHFYCPFHGAKYDQTGCYVGHMKCKPMRLHPLFIDDGGTITVDTARFYNREAYDESQAVPAKAGAQFNTNGLEAIEPEQRDGTQ
ncbi:MAG: Rieske 2Fe-2S domain-containing protein [Rhodospirillales bacterium]|jgi:catechol 2,3-dioxygenase-like lactoylglutathione lyase family enzyme/nitrite reductase/ring-hydroxylating ferredoxin subunit|nr:Rieske 2Fe-2S domain-containing protein [Rhodospirillales bacterium]MBT5075210.1 Rieske 2Fe-2S domain-containing protein [Rhodospirillales bacterium]MBT5113602.1 Rieske 2Fe-2S domain-containing protein [Rhodospirillales bacterium]MBT5673900.1 Rieske 2Fe-2S domain-containing protein [Rhodospirillales bacterium]MBT6186558.1 Rieske 2Fe-2S domain-containing protein [Rhodospirillales bacterium]